MTALKVAPFVILFLILAVALGDNIYRMNRTRWPDWKAKVLTGDNIGRGGVVVSHYPFDMLVTINTEANQTEIDALIQERLAMNAGWKMPSPNTRSGEDVVEQTKNARAWITEWRWNCEFHSDDPLAPRQ